MNQTTRCRHAKTTAGPDGGFTGPAYPEGPRGENRAAHGGICYVETCDRCGARREVNSNGRHVERGAWVKAKH